MEIIELKSRAKINLSLDVLGRRPNGYHEVEMLMQTLELSDSLTIEKKKGEIDVCCDAPFMPQDFKNNIAYKAAEEVIRTYDIKSGVKINIIKRIPVSAGLAGGSTNAAAVIKGLNELFSLNLSEEKLRDIGKRIGADVPYCIKGGTMLATGIGEILTEVDQLPKTNILLVKPEFGVSTPWVYNNLNLSNLGQRPDTPRLIKAIKEKDISFLASNMRNVLESVTIPQHPIIDEIKEKMLREGAMGSMMSGSGPTVFGIFSDIDIARKAFNVMAKDNRWKAILTATD